MARVTRALVLENLGPKWQEQSSRFQGLTAAEQRAFLEKQGYATYGDMLVHIFAWWNECARVIRAVQQDPAGKPVEPNVDEFNARVIAEHAGVGDAERTAELERARTDLADLVTGLPEEVLQHEVVDEWLFWCVTNHLNDHAVKP